MECRHWNSSYKVCKVQDAQKVQTIEKIAQFPITSGSQCSRGIDFGIIEDSIWINNGCNGIYKVGYYTGIDLDLQTQKIYTENLKKNFRENKSTCIIFLTWLMKWAFFLLINQSAKKLPVLFNKDKVKVNSRLCRSQIWSLSVYYKWVLSQRVFIIFLNTSFAHTVRIIKISWTLFPLVFYDHLCQS